MPSDLPQGVVTFLFSDIEGSTRLLMEQGEAYADLLARHRDVLRSAFSAHSGVVVDSQGDAFLVAFARASDALAAAIHGQRALTDGPVRVRMGIHSGEPNLRDDAYVGLVVHKGARIAAAGHGGQVLLSAATRALTDLPVLDLGTHHLKDLAAPERIFHLLIEGLPGEFPPLRSPAAGRGGIPSPVTSFVGREAELSLIGELLESGTCRLVTLVGPGGTGKTRLAVEVARTRASRHSHGVTHLEMGHLSDEADLLPVVADGLGFSVDTAHAGGRAPVDQLIDFLEPRDDLLVVDDIGHLSRAAGLLERVLQGAPRVTILATSRSRLQLAGEWVVEVGGLGAADARGQPDQDQPSAARSGPHAAAVQLFIERARQVAPRFSLDDKGWQAVVRICQLVDGMPLGIELAAAWMHTLTPSELLDEVEQDFDILSTTSPNLPERHRSLRAAFEGSWRLLSEDQQRTLARLSIFRAPFTREAAQAVAGTGLAILAELVNRSLIAPAGERRFAMHALVRQFAAEAPPTPGQGSDIGATHARFFAQRLLTAIQGPEGQLASVLRRRVRPDQPDLHAALMWAVVHWPGREVAAFLRSLDVLYGVGGEPGAVDLFRMVVALMERERRPELDAGEAVPCLVLARLRLALGLAELDLNAESETLARDCLTRLDAPELGLERGLCLMALGINAANRDEGAEAGAALGEATRLLRAERAEREVVGTLLWLGWAHLMIDDQDSARIAFEEAHATSVRLDDPELLGYSLSKLALLEDSQGRYEEALERHLRAHAAFEASDSVAGVGYALSRASMSAYCLGRADDALRHAQGAHEAFRKIGHHWGTTISLCRLAFALLGTGQPLVARRHAQDALRRASWSRITLLHALTTLGAAEAALGDAPSGIRILSLVLAQPELPAIYRVLAERELASVRREAGPAELPEAEGLTAVDSVEALVDVLLGREVSSVAG